MIRRSSLMLFAVVALLGAAVRVQAHCQLPCGIYDDEASFASMREAVATIDKTMTLIEDKATSQNQVVRAILVKDEAAAKIQEIVSSYFLTQRIKPETENYDKKLEALHQILVFAMKAKQTTDKANVAKLNELISAFHELYVPKA